MLDIDRSRRVIGTDDAVRRKGDNLFGFKRKLTLRQRLRRRVNELISSVNFTRSAGGELGPVAADSC
jgi:hypothetical protein